MAPERAFFMPVKHVPSEDLLEKPDCCGLVSRREIDKASPIVSASLKMRTICSSVKRFLFHLLPPVDTDK